MCIAKRLLLMALLDFFWPKLVGRRYDELAGIEGLMVRSPVVDALRAPDCPSTVVSV